MRSLSAAELLSIWECAAAQPMVQKALLLLAASCPEVPREELAKLTIGQRDSLLLKLRKWMFGSCLEGYAVCPGCNDRVELSFDIEEIRVKTETEKQKPLWVAFDGYKVAYRLPDSNDLMAISGCMDITTGCSSLLSRCLIDVQHNGENLQIAHLPQTFLDAVAKQMADADPQANVDLEMDCPSCGHNWSASFDIVSYLWSEIETCVHRLLQDIHTLASAYGWSESAILSLSAQRRQRYLNMISGM
jgi:hypothetical protein